MQKIKNNKMIFAVISIIVILISVGVFGLVLNHNDNRDEVQENINDNINNDRELDNKISDEEKENDNLKFDEIIDSDDQKDNTNVDKEENKNESNVTSTKPDKEEDKSNLDNNTSESKPSDETTNKPEDKEEVPQPEENDKLEVKPEVPSIVEDKNSIKRSTMESAYGIKILFGDEIGDYTPKGVTPIRLTDSNEVENYLNRLNIELAKYPKGFFNDFNKKGMPLTIYLVKSVNGAFSGFTDYQFMNNIKLTLATDYNFEYTIHHELMHYIDCYLDIVMYPNNPYQEYEALNPSGFVYGTAVSSQIYNMGSNQRGAYFISSYGSTHVKEDRAEVFKYMTARAYKPIGCFEPNEIIRKKAEIISKQIRTYFPSVAGSAHWDRFIS